MKKGFVIFVSLLMILSTISFVSARGSLDEQEEILPFYKSAFKNWELSNEVSERQVYITGQKIFSKDYGTLTITEGSVRLVRLRSGEIELVAIDNKPFKVKSIYNVLGDFVPTEVENEKGEKHLQALVITGSWEDLTKRGTYKYGKRKALATKQVIIKQRYQARFPTSVAAVRG